MNNDSFMVILWSCCCWRVFRQEWEEGGVGKNSLLKILVVSKHNTDMNAFGTSEHNADMNACGIFSRVNLNWKVAAPHQHKTLFGLLLKEQFGIHQPFWALDCCRKQKYQNLRGDPLYSLSECNTGHSCGPSCSGARNGYSIPSPPPWYHNILYHCPSLQCLPATALDQPIPAVPGQCCESLS